MCLRIKSTGQEGSPGGSGVGDFPVERQPVTQEGVVAILEEQPLRLLLLLLRQLAAPLLEQNRVGVQPLHYQLLFGGCHRILHLLLLVQHTHCRGTEDLVIRRLHTNHCDKPFSEKLTQLVDMNFHPGHFLKHSLAPDGVVTVGPMESLRVLVDRALDGAQVEQSGGHGKDHEGFFNPARSHPELPGYRMSIESRTRGRSSSTVDVMCCWCFLSPDLLSSGVHTDYA